MFNRPGEGFGNRKGWGNAYAIWDDERLTQWGIGRPRQAVSQAGIAVFLMIVPFQWKVEMAPQTVHQANQGVFGGNHPDLKRECHFPGRIGSSLGIFALINIDC
jgi:hypothetical protein